MNIKLNYVSVSQAEAFAQILSNRAWATENRVLILSPNGESTTSGGIIIPGSVKEGMPRKGVVITRGTIDEAYANYEPLTQQGMIVTYGLYAGKEIEFDKGIFPEPLRHLLDSNSFYVLSLNEIILSEINN